MSRQGLLPINTISAKLYYSFDYKQHEDMEDFTSLRQIMVQQQLIRRGIADPKLIAAMKAVPRHEFFPLDFKTRSYADTPLPIGFEQTISRWWPSSSWGVSSYL